MVKKNKCKTKKILENFTIFTFCFNLINILLHNVHVVRPGFQKLTHLKTNDKD